LAAPGLAVCPGDCDGNDQVTIAELIRSVNIALGNTAVGTCTAADGDGNGMVAINELIAAVDASLNGCPIEPIFPANYRDTYPLVRDCRFSIEHGGPMIRVWANPLSAQPYLDEDNPLPVGSIFGVLKFELRRPNVSATTVANGYTVDEPTMLM